MDRPTDQPQPPPQSGHRDMMFCHECQDEWYRDENGLTCPECGSDFTEIIEEDNDPRNDHGHSEEDDDDEMMHPIDAPPGILHPLHHHNPFRQNNDDPEEGDISNFQFRQLGPGRYAMTGTMYRTVSPGNLNQGGAGSPGPGAIGGFASMLNSIIGGARAMPQNQDGQDGEAAQGQGTPTTGFGQTPGGHRFTYTAGARLHPRDPNNPGPHMEPVDELNNVLVGLMAAFGESPGAQRDPFSGQGTDPHHHAHPMNPLVHLFAHMMGGNGQFGDAVYSQEALDRIISQLMEQNATSNAPGPAPQAEIDSLPRKEVTVDMLGPEGRAECSICMEEVNIGEQVTELPCKHWFHHGCVAAWLGEHDTCPHCRKGISKQGNEQNESQNQPNNFQGPSSPGASRTMPGAFGSAGGVAGEGSPENPCTGPGSPPPNQMPSNDQPPPDEQNSTGGGFADRVRRGLFGPPSR